MDLSYQAFQQSNTSTPTATGGSGLNLSPSAMNTSTPVQKQGIFSKIGSAINNKIITPIQTAEKQSAADINTGMNEANPHQGALDTLNGIAEGAGSFLAPILQPFSEAIQSSAEGQKNSGLVGEILNKVVNNPTVQKFAMSGAGQATAKVAGNISKLANIAGTAIGLGAGAEDAMSPEAPETETSTGNVAIEDARNIASDSIKNPLSTGEQQSALRGGRLTDSSIPTLDNPNPKVGYKPDVQTVKMTNALQPLAEDGRLKAPTTLENQANNIGEVSKELATQKTQLRAGLETSKAIWNTNELKGTLNNVDIPDPVKNEPTLNRNVTSLKNATVKLAEDVSKKPVGLLDLRQNFDGYVQDNYGKGFFDKGRSADPFHSYVYSLRDSLNDFAASKLPEGKLPDGTSYRDALQNQHQLINAQDEMVAKTTREYPEGSKPTSRFMESHPLIRRAFTREALGVGLGAVGATALTAGAKKILPYIESKL